MRERKCDKNKIKSLFFLTLVIFTFITMLFLLHLSCSDKVANPTLYFHNSSETTRRWALVVGISDYPGTINDLQYCDDDAIVMKKWLMNQNFPEENIKVIINAQATKDNILKGLLWIANVSTGQDYVVFFYSAHGNKAGSISTLVPYDYYTSGELYGNELGNALNQINCSKMLILIDACYSGGLINWLKGQDRIIITSCSSSESSYEDTFYLKQGVFTAFFTESYKNLNADSNKDKKVTVEEAFNYTYIKSREYTLKVFNNAQTAQLSDDILGDFFLSPYIEVNYVENLYSNDFINIIIYAIGFDEPINLTLLLYSENTIYRTYSIDNLINSSQIGFVLRTYGSFIFRLTVVYSGGIYKGAYYSLNLKSYFYSPVGLIIILTSCVASGGVSIVMIYIYKGINFKHIHLRKENKEDN